jgi:hypothetical protein
MTEYIKNKDSSLAHNKCHRFIRIQSNTCWNPRELVLHHLCISLQRMWIHSIILNSVNASPLFCRISLIRTLLHLSEFIHHQVNRFVLQWNHDVEFISYLARMNVSAIWLEIISESLVTKGPLISLYIFVDILRESFRCSF